MMLQAWCSKPKSDSTQRSSSCSPGLCQTSQQPFQEYQRNLRIFLGALYSQVFTIAMNFDFPFCKRMIHMPTAPFIGDCVFAIHLMCVADGCFIVSASSVHLLAFGSTSLSYYLSVQIWPGREAVTRTAVFRVA